MNNPSNPTIEHASIEMIRRDVAKTLQNIDDHIQEFGDKNGEEVENPFVELYNEVEKIHFDLKKSDISDRPEILRLLIKTKKLWITEILRLELIQFGD
jgi:hypothetical protein